MKGKNQNKKFVYVIEHHEGKTRFIESICENFEEVKKQIKFCSFDMARLKIISKWAMGSKYPYFAKDCVEVYDYNFTKWPGKFYLSIAIHGFLHNWSVNKQDEA